MLKMSYSGFTAVQCFMQGLEISGGWSLGASVCTCWPYENPATSDLAVNHCSLLAHAQQSLSEIQMLSVLKTCLVQSMLLPVAKGTQKTPDTSRRQRDGCPPLSHPHNPPCNLCLDSALNSTGGEKEKKNNGSKEKLQDSTWGQAGCDVQRQQGQR